MSHTYKDQDAKTNFTAQDANHRRLRRDRHNGRALAHEIASMGIDELMDDVIYAEDGKMVRQ